MQISKRIFYRLKRGGDFAFLGVAQKLNGGGAQKIELLGYAGAILVHLWSRSLFGFNL